jgi:hypothetical protein
MIVRSAWRKLLLAAMCLVPAACEPHRSWLRPKPDDDWMSRTAESTDDAKSRKVIGGSPDDADSSGFFRNNRRSGGLSSEARQIEKDLNVY